MTVALFYTGPSPTELHEDYAKKHRIDDHAMAGPMLALVFFTSRKCQALLETCLAKLKASAEARR